MKRSRLWIIAGMTLLVVARVSFLVNFRLSIEFTGWVEAEIPVVENREWLENDLRDAFILKNYTDVVVSSFQSSDSTSLLVTTEIADDERVAEVSDIITSLLVDKWYLASKNDILSLSLNGPTVSSYMKSSALRALWLWLVFMAIYMIFSFASVRSVMSPLSLAVVTIVTMIFDISIPAWVYGLLMMINPIVQVDTIFVIAILTTMWYSINDTIVIFDRIRENAKSDEGKLKAKWSLYGEVFEKSLWQTMRRSIGTSLSTLLVVFVMYLFGTGVIQQFAFTMWIGILAGTYSSIFLAAPLAYIMLGKFGKEYKKLK